MTRREIREQAFVLLFEKMFNNDNTLTELADYAEESGLFTVHPFAMEIAVRTMDNIANLDERLSSLSRKWSLNRLSRVTLTILRLAASEILYFDDIPVSVSINEAVELAKKYATVEDSSFINGILGTFARNLTEAVE